MILLLATTALAWQSECYSDREDDKGVYALCEGAEEKATARWIPTMGRYYEESETALAEHWQIWNYAAAAGGLPEPLQDGVLRLEVYARPGEVIPRHPGQEPAGTLEVVTRTREIGELTQLPDMSYSLQDWAQANSDCPLEGVSNDTCHEFMGHLGALNSTHFLPQAQDWYFHLHAIALQHAGACLAISTAGEHHTESILACEKQALAVEAVAQHYLQDAWSSGHMWERWGSPNIKDFDGLGEALAVAAFAGTWHGVKALLERKFLGSWDDPMCAPAPDNPWGDIQYEGVDGVLYPGLGDLFWSTVVQNESYAHQRDSLTSCGVSGMAEVYQATGQVHGELKTIPDTEALYGKACWGQRATNASLAVGSLVHTGSAPKQLSVGGSPQGAIGRAVYGTGVAVLLAGLLRTNGHSLQSGNLAQFRHDAARLHTQIVLKAKLSPKGTDMASGGLNSLLNAPTNGVHQGEPLPSWADPTGPWSIEDAAPGAQALGLMFLETGILDRCDQDLEKLTALRRSGAASSAAEQSFCERMVTPHLRIGTSSTAYDPRYEPICEQNILYSGHPNFGALPFEQALEQYCNGTLLQDGSFEENEASSPWELDGAAALGPGVNTLVPREGAGVLDLALNSSGAQTYSIVSQHLLGPVKSGATVSFYWRTIGDTPQGNECSASQGPIFGVRLDDGEYGNGDAIRVVQFDEWCDSLEYWGGGWSILEDWQHIEVSIPDQSYEKPILSLYITDNTRPDYHLLVDSIELEQP